MTMIFLGKWTLKQGSDYVQIDPSSGVLKVAGLPSDNSEKFNAYGSTDSFMLQANNGLYITSQSQGTSYIASLGRDDNVHYFSIVGAASGESRILDMGAKGTGTSQYYWNNASGALQGIAKSSTPPASTAFTKAIVTEGQVSFLQSGFSSPTPDLTWVYLSGADYSSASGQFTLSQATLSNADLSNITFPFPFSFQTATGDKLNLSGAIVKQTTFDDSTFSNINLTGAQMQGASLSDVSWTTPTMTGAKLSGFGTGLQNAKFLDGAKMQNVDMSNAQISGTDFTGADLSGAIFTTAQVSGITINDANLTGAYLNNPKEKFEQTIFMQQTLLNSKTNFSNAHLQYNDFSGFDLSNVVMSHANFTGCSMDNVKLNNAEMSYGNFTGVTMTGGIPMYGANLSNATLTGATLTGAQMGGISLQFKVPSTGTDYASFLQALNADDTTTVKKVFVSNGVTLSGTVVINQSQYAQGRVWHVEATEPSQITYTVRLEPLGTGTTTSLDVYTSATAAILTNAFMRGVILTSANLYNVRASGVQLYGGAKLDGHAILEGVQFDNANLGNINLSQARLYGINLDYTILTGANLQGAKLGPSAAGGVSTLNKANLQGADFTTAQLDYAIFTDAAVSVANATTPTTANGVWLFEASASQASLVTGELNTANTTYKLDQLANEANILLPYLTPGIVQAPLIAAYAKLTPAVTIDPKSILSVIADGIYWQVTDGSKQYVIFDDCNANYRPALGVASGTAFTTTATFTMPLSLKDNLINGKVDAEIIAAFKKYGSITLSTSASITVAQHALDLQIVQPSGSNYTLWLGLYSSLTGCSYSIYTRLVIPNLISLFAGHSIPLSHRTQISSTSTGLWSVNNDADNPFNPQTNYIKFNLLLNSDDSLDIYGSFLRIIRLSADDVQEYYNIPSANTTLTEATLAATTVCPNSIRKDVNQNNKLLFDQWMRAKTLPSAPFCVPSADGTLYCPT